MITQIGPIIKELMETPAFKPRWIEYSIKSMWVKWVGEKMAKHIKPLKLRADKLAVTADDERWAKAFEELQDKVLEKLQHKLGKGVINGFFIWNEKKEPGKRVQIKKTKKISPEKNPSPVSCEINTDQKIDVELEERLSAIKDTEIRSTLRRLILKSGYFEHQADKD